MHLDRVSHREASGVVSYSITCPQCLSLMRYAKAPAQMKKIKCPKCGFGMTIPAAEAHPSFFPGQPPPVPPSAQRPRPAAGSPPPMPPPLTPGPFAGFDQPGPPQPMPGQDPYARDPFVDDYDDAYAPPRRGKKGLVIGLSVVAVLLLLAGVGLVLWLFVFSGPSLVGRWEPIDMPGAPTLEFTGDGRLITRDKDRTREVRYKIVGNTIEVDRAKGGKDVQSFRFDGKELLIGAPPLELRYRRL